MALRPLAVACLVGCHWSTESNVVLWSSSQVKGKGKGLDTCHSATYMSQTRDQLKWQLIGMSQWCRSALCGHPIPALMDNWTHVAANRHIIDSISHTRPLPRSCSYTTHLFPVPLRVGCWVKWLVADRRPRKCLTSYIYIHIYKWFITRTMSNKMVESEARAVARWQENSDC